MKMHTFQVHGVDFYFCLVVYNESAANFTSFLIFIPVGFSRCRSLGRWEAGCQLTCHLFLHLHKVENCSLICLKVFNRIKFIPQIGQLKLNTVVNARLIFSKASCNKMSSDSVHIHFAFTKNRNS